MPRTLKKETSQRLAISQQALSQAFVMLSNPKLESHKLNICNNALEMGLIGIAAELAISACLCEAFGSQSLIREETGFYITAGEALDVFRKGIAEKKPSLYSLAKGLDAPEKHLEELGNSCSNYKVFFSARAFALHAGEGVARDAAYYAGTCVVSFLTLLAKSPKWRSALTAIPVIHTPPKEQKYIAQELAKRLNSEQSESQNIADLYGLFLVLPELTVSEPDWLSKLEHVQVTPRKRDIAILIKSLQQSQVGVLFKVGKSGDAIPARIDPSNPDALPIAPNHLKNEFQTNLDKWTAEYALANQAIAKNTLQLPPITSVYHFAALGIDKIGLPPDQLSAGLSAHVLWPFIASALIYRGTKGPCLIFIKALKKGELGQLLSILTKAGKLSKLINSSLTSYQPLFEKQLYPETKKAETEFERKLNSNILTRNRKRGELLELLRNEQSTVNGSLRAEFDKILETVNQSGSISEALRILLEGQVQIGTKKISVLRNIIVSANEYRDLAVLNQILLDTTLAQVATETRKAFLEIDYYFFGPCVLSISK